MQGIDALPRLGLALSDVRERSIDKDTEKILDLLATYLISVQDDQEIRTYLQQVSKVLIQHLVYESRDFQPEVISSFIVESINLLKWGPELRGITFQDLFESRIENIFGSLDKVLSRFSSSGKELGRCRFRIYTTHPDDYCYRGFKSRGMPEDWRYQFDVTHESLFGKTKAIPFVEPNFKRLEETNCYILSEDRLSEMTGEGLDFYTQFLGIGDTERGVPMTYTWEFTVDGLSPLLCRRALPADKPSYVLAFSIDTGSGGLDYQNRILDPWLIRLMDVLWASSFGKDLGACFGYLLHSLENGENPTVSTLIQVDKEIRGARQVKSDLKASWDIDTIVLGSGDYKWVFANGDPAGERLRKDFDRLKGVKKSILVLGPSGSGKEVFLRALHSEGLKPDSRIETVPYRTIVINRENIELAIIGSERHGFTGASASPGPIPGMFERNHGGSVIIDELVEVRWEEQTVLRTVVDNLQKKPPIGFTRMGGTDIITPDVRIFSTGKNASSVDPDMKRRFKETVKTPGWAQLTQESRVAISRWFIVRGMKNYKIKSVAVSRQLYRFLVGNPDSEAFTVNNMNFVENMIDSMCEEYSGCQSVRLTLQALSGRLSLYEETEREVSEAIHGEEDFPTELSLGLDSPLRYTNTKLNTILKPALKIAICEKGSSCTGCIDMGDLAIILQITQPQEGLDLLYFLYAACWMQGDKEVSTRTTESRKEDGDQTAPGVIEKHFGPSYDQFRIWLAETTDCTPVQFRCSNRIRNKGFNLLKSHVEDQARRRSFVEMTHVMQCVVPQFPDLPFWPKKKRSEKIGGETDESLDTPEI